MRVVLRRDAAAGQQRGGDENEGDDGGKLDHGQPEFDAAVRADAAQIDDEKQSCEDNNPEIGAHAGKPCGHVSGGGDHFRADGEGEADPVAGARDESSEVVEIKIAIDAEAAGGGMGTGQFAESHGDRPVDEGGGDKTKNGRGSCDLHGCAGAKEKTGTDGTSDRDHGHLSGAELVAKAVFIRGRVVNLWWGVRRRHGAPYQKLRERACVMQASDWNRADY